IAGMRTASKNGKWNILERIRMDDTHVEHLRLAVCWRRLVQYHVPKIEIRICHAHDTVRIQFSGIRVHEIIELMVYARARQHECIHALLHELCCRLSPRKIQCQAFRTCKFQPVEYTSTRFDAVEPCFQTSE